MSKIPLVIRAHIRDSARLPVTERTLRSALDKNLPDICDITVLDDSSPLGDGLCRLCEILEIKYKKAGGSPSTINGLMESLKLADGNMVCCVDDIVFGKGTKEILTDIWERMLPHLDNHGVSWGLLGLSLCYDRRIDSVLYGLPLFELVPTSLVYALMFHFYSTALKSALFDKWERIQSGQIPVPGFEDDIFVSKTLGKTGLRYFNTVRDYAWHTGAHIRSFGPHDGGKNSEYQTKCFVGE